MLKVFRGIERIRTAVAAFAELSLATRPRCLIRLANVKKLNLKFLLKKQITVSFSS